MEGEIDTEQFMEEIRKYDCLFNSFSKEFKDKFKEINAWSKVREVSSISPAAAEKKFRDIRTAYGHYLKQQNSVPSGSGRDAVPIPCKFVNLEWLSVHIGHRPTVSNVPLASPESESSCSTTPSPVNEDDSSERPDTIQLRESPEYGTNEYEHGGAENLENTNLYNNFLFGG